jgi:hypothetical protein
LGTPETRRPYGSSAPGRPGEDRHILEGERTGATTVAENKRVYKRHTKRPNVQDFEALPEAVAPGRYREICVNFTPG